MINLNAYKKLGKRERILAVVLLMIISAGIYYQALYKPLTKNIRTYKFQIQKLTTRLNEIETRFPQVDTQKERLDLLKDECNRLLGDIIEIENKLPGEREASQLIAEVGRLAKDFKLNSVQQKIDMGEEYSRIFIELKFSAPYGQVVNYIKKLETISPYLKIDEMELSEPKRMAKRRGMQARIVLSSLLGKMPLPVRLKAEEEGPTAAVRDIFISRVKPVSEIRKTELKLEGITYDPQTATAIINNDVVKIGSRIGEFKVKKILPDTVILTDGYEEYFLSIAR